MQAEYITLSTAPNQAAEVAQALATLPAGAGEAELSAGFTPLIGLSINTVMVLARASQAAAFDATATRLAAVENVTAIDRVRLEAVQERDLACLAPDDAMYTNRWFHVRQSAAEAFEADTLAAWATFESGTDSQVVGLWKAPPRDGVTSYLLIARYADLAAWSRSRYWNRPQAEQDSDWIERFRRRREMMVDSSVIAARCLFAAT